MTFESDRLLFLESVHRELASAAYRRVLSRVARASGTMAGAMRVRWSVTSGGLYIPHYWALYVHDGRGPVRPVNRVYLVWFPNKSDDPRLAGGYPERESDIVRLTRDQFFAGLEENRERSAAGLPPFMIVTKYSGPTTPNRFFDELVISDLARDIVRREFEEFLLKNLPKEKDTARIRL